jgi:hypothetical protein
MKSLLLLLVLACIAPALVAAQETPPAVTVQRTTWRQSVVHYGKWLTAASAIAFTALAEREHRQSQREWDRLLDICRANNTACALGPDGRYRNYQAELHYTKSIYYDHRARHRLLAGQLSLLATAAMFIADLRPDKGPGNIPFHPLEVGPAPGGDGVSFGLRFTF